MVMSKYLRVLLAAVAYCLAPLNSNADQPPPPSIRILQPTDGTVLPSQMDVEIVAELAPSFQDPSNFNFIRFTVARPDGTLVFDTGPGDLRSRRSLDQAWAIWNPSRERSGDYIITVFLEDQSGNLFEDNVEVTLNRAPDLRVDVLTTRIVLGGAEVRLRARTTDIERDPIVRALWVPGDGSAPVVFPDLTPFTHVYAGAQGQKVNYVVTVTVDDARGGRTTAQRQITVNVPTVGRSEVRVTRPSECGCTKMDIFSVAGLDSFTYCQQGAMPPPSPGCVAVGNPAGVEACPADTTPFQCPLGPFSPGDLGANYLGWRFEINAHLDPRSTDIRACTEGQVNRSDLSRAGAAVPNPQAQPDPPAGGRLPFPDPPPRALVAAPDVYPAAAGPDWGADDYTRERNFKRHLQGIERVRWLDAPRIPRNAANALADHAVFVAWVTGRLGTCWCEFEYNHAWTLAGGRTGPGGAAAPQVITRLNGRNCDP